jgi:hypothetical protein
MLGVMRGLNRWARGNGCFVIGGCDLGPDQLSPESPKRGSTPINSGPNLSEIPVEKWLENDVARAFGEPLVMMN